MESEIVHYWPISDFTPKKSIRQKFSKIRFEKFAWANFKNFHSTESEIKFEVIWCAYIDVLVLETIDNEYVPKIEHDP